jgi:hypothetical protein
MANARVYQWEYIDLEPAVVNFGNDGPGAYLEHICDWAPQGRATRGSSLVATWGEIGIAGSWPRAVNLWEHADLAELAHTTALSEAVQHNPLPPEPEFQRWLEKAGKLRVETTRKLLFPAEYSPPLAELLERGVRGRLYCHDTLGIVAGRVDDFLERLGREGLPDAQAAGLDLVGAFRNGLCCDSEAIVIWACADFAAWAAYEDARAEPAFERQLVRRRERLLLVAGARSPLQTGRLL